MESSIAIDVAAPPSLVFALARDVRRWPDLLPHYVAVRPSGPVENGLLTARMIARRPLVTVLGLGLPVAWRAMSWNEPDQLRLRFRHIGGATRGMDVTWRIEPSEGGCRVTIEHRFSPRIASIQKGERYSHRRDDDLFVGAKEAVGFLQVTSRLTHQ